MKSKRCKLIVVRDKLTARGLKGKGVMAYAPGNPMMDAIQKSKCPVSIDGYRRVILLCGSRWPEAMDNFKRQVKAIELINSKDNIVILTALGSEPKIDIIESYLSSLGYKKGSLFKDETFAQSSFSKDNHIFLIGSGNFSKWASWAEVGISNAGTATEQLVGLGVPALSLPGKGPQFKGTFAKRQSRLLGGSVLPCRSPAILANRIKFLLQEKSLITELGKIGVRRMGRHGGSASIAKLISELVLNDAKNQLEE